MSVAVAAAAPHRASEADNAAKSAEAARLNNIGVAYMNQQLFEKALKQFEGAAAQDPKLLIAKLNRAVALLNLCALLPMLTFLWYVKTGLAAGAQPGAAGGDAGHRRDRV